MSSTNQKVNDILNEIQEKIEAKVEEENKNCQLRNHPEFKDLFDELGKIPIDEFGDKKQIYDKLSKAQLRSGWNGVIKFVENKQINRYHITNRNFNKNHYTNNNTNNNTNHHTNHHSNYNNRRNNDNNYK
jgi:hypothetical protein